MTIFSCFVSLFLFNPPVLHLVIVSLFLLLFFRALFCCVYFPTHSYFTFIFNPPVFDLVILSCLPFLPLEGWLSVVCLVLKNVYACPQVRGGGACYYSHVTLLRSKARIISTGFMSVGM